MKYNFLPFFFFLGKLIKSLNSLITVITFKYNLKGKLYFNT